MRYTSHSDNETIAIGKKISAQLKGGDVVCLHGELGAGKTTLMKGIAKGLGVKEEITSPTFSLMNVYNCHSDPASAGKESLKSKRKGPFGQSPEAPSLRMTTLVHIDTYRLKNEQELIEIGVEDYLGQPNTVCAVEWAEKISSLLEDKRTINIRLNHKDSEYREIKIEE